MPSESAALIPAASGMTVGRLIEHLSRMPAYMTTESAAPPPPPEHTPTCLAYAWRYGRCLCRG